MSGYSLQDILMDMNPTQHVNGMLLHHPDMTLPFIWRYSTVSVFFSHAKSLFQPAYEVIFLLTSVILFTGGSVFPQFYGQADPPPEGKSPFPLKTNPHPSKRRPSPSKRRPSPSSNILLECVLVNNIFIFKILNFSLGLVPEFTNILGIIFYTYVTSFV